MTTEISQPLLITVEETMRMLRIGRTKLYSLIHQEGLPVHRFGRRVLIDPNELRPWLAHRRLSR
jgi:excisionase family DNA binding protein